MQTDENTTSKNKKINKKKTFFWSTWKIKYTRAWLPTYPRAMQFILSHQKLIKSKLPLIDDRPCAFMFRKVSDYKCDTKY